FQILLFSKATTPLSQFRTRLDSINPPCSMRMPKPFRLDGMQSWIRTSLILALFPVVMPVAHQLVTIPSIATWAPAKTHVPNPLMIPGPHRKLLSSSTTPAVEASMLRPMTAKPFMLTAALGGKIRQPPTLALVVMLLTRVNCVSLGLETRKSAHADTDTS